MSSSTSFASWDRPTSSWRTWTALSGPGSTPFSGRWPTSGSMRNGRCYPRPQSALHIAEVVSSSSPIHERPNWNHLIRLAYAASWCRPPLLLPSGACEWATPLFSDTRSGSVSAATLARNSRPLREQVLLHCSLLSRLELTPGVNCFGSGPTLRRRLNPRFAEWLMGWPIGWTGSGAVETESFLSRQRRLLFDWLED